MKNMHDVLTAKIAAAALIRERGDASGPVMTSMSALSRGRNCVKRCLPSSVTWMVAWLRSRNRKTSPLSMTIVM
jgi:hypothetical protein